MTWFQEQFNLIQSAGTIPVLISLVVILLLESLLSVDNAAALASIINKNLKDPKEKNKALFYGMAGAYLFRGLSLLFVGYLLANPTVGDVVKVLGGLYLLRLAYTYFTAEVDSIEEGDTTYTTYNFLTPFWSTVVSVEILDLSLSIDNILACISMSDIVLVVIVAVLLGILLMRVVTMQFIKLMEKYPALETSAFIVIFLLGVRLLLSGFFHYINSPVHSFLESHTFDTIFSITTMVIFIFPVLKSKFNG